MANLRNFFNKVSNNNLIFTAEDIGDMSPDEFSTHEQAINYQMNNLGIPRSMDLEGDSDVIFVRAYTKSDGTQVKAHYRSRSGYFGGQSQSGFAQERDTSKILNDGCFSSNSPVIDEKQGHFDPITGKKVYYDGMQYLGNENNLVDEIIGDITGAAAPTTDIPQETYNIGIKYNDYSPIFKQLLNGTLPELIDLNQTGDNQNKYYKSINYQTFPPHNDEALIDEWAIPNLVMGGIGLKTGLEFAPYAKDIWAGKNLLFHKPFKLMSREELKAYGKLGEQYYKNYLQKNPVNIKEYGETKFTRHNIGKDKTTNMEQYPFLRKNLKNAKKGSNTNTKNEADRTYDHFYNHHKHNKYEYIIEKIKDNQNKILKNYKMMKNKTKGE